MAGNSKRTSSQSSESSKWEMEVSLFLSSINIRVVIDRLEISKPFFDRKTGRQSFNRVIPGLNIVVPWPKRGVTFTETKEDRLEKAKDPIKYPDTPTPLVNEKTFGNPTLHYPPLPPGIELELHNQYSKFKRQKFGKAFEQMAEWRRRYEPGVKESEELSKEIEAKDQNVYTAEQLRIRAANKLVKKARKTYFKRKEMTNDDVMLLAEYMKIHIESKMKKLIGPERAVKALTPLEQAMTPEQRLAHRKKRVVMEEQQIAERRKNALSEARARKIAARQDRGRYKTFEIHKSVRPPVRKRIKKKKRQPTLSR
jgi:Large ribosomal subunit protein uL24m